METILLFVLPIAAGFIGWYIGKTQESGKSQGSIAAAKQEFAQLDKGFAEYKAKVIADAENQKRQAEERLQELDAAKAELKESNSRLNKLSEEFNGTKALLKATEQTVGEKKADLERLNGELTESKNNYTSIVQKYATEQAKNQSLEEKLTEQKKQIDELNKTFAKEFELIANRILDAKTEKFTELNKTNLKAILDPLGKNLSEFKTKVEEVYDKEAKERFSLGQKVKELADLNKVISDEARNLTRALKGEAKTQGRWGEMILESILEKSGLVKDREYFLQQELKDADGQALLSDSEGKKMRPDVVIKYPDHRSVIIDSKVSLNAYTRYIASDDPAEQKKELEEHVAAIKNHIVDLSTKGYDDYKQSLDFVMMFVPSEPAYNVAIQADPNLWNFAYDKRILLISPTNLIVALKLIVDLWKREYQNQNALAIAERGGKLLDKFTGFVKNLEGVGEYLLKAQGKYDEAHKQLTTGNDNLVTQATKLRDLGVKAKKDLPPGLSDLDSGKQG